MVDYKIVKYCILCKTRFVVNKGQSKSKYCPECQEKMAKEAARKAEEAKIGEEISSDDSSSDE